MNFYQDSKLQNGLRVITGENKNSDVITVSIWIRAGSRYEDADSLGYAHLLEHMLFRGTKSRPSSFDVSVDIDRIGGIANAFTGQERIYFFAQAAKEHLQVVCSFLSDVIMNPLFDPSVLENEKKVVLQELRRRTDDSRQSIQQEAMGSLLKGHPLSNIPLGNEPAIMGATVENLAAYHGTRFAPSNAAVIMTGCVDHETATALAKKYFGEWAGDVRIKENKIPIYPPSQHFLFQKKETSQYYLVFGFLSKNLSWQESLGADLIADFLGYGHTSLLYQELRHKKGLLYTLSCYDKNFQDANLFQIEAATSQPVEVVGRTIDIVGNVGELLKNELDNLKRQEIGIFLRRISDPLMEMKYLGEQWVSYNCLVPPREFIEGIEGVSYEVVRSVSEVVLAPDNLLLAVLGPDEKNAEKIANYLQGIY